MPEPTRDVGPVRFTLADRDAAVARVVSAIGAGAGELFAFCNMHTFNLARRSPEVARALGQATVFNDGVGMDIASRVICGVSFPANLNGTDLTPAVLAALRQPTSLYLIGSPPGVAQIAAEALQARFPLVSVVGVQHGYFPAEQDGAVADQVKRSGAQLVLVGMGNPRQELWAAVNGGKIGAVVICVGAFLDFASGRVPRAPALVRQLRCEWLYRMAIEPRRLWRRYIIGGMTFAVAVLRERQAAMQRQ